MELFYEKERNSYASIHVPRHTDKHIYTFAYEYPHIFLSVRMFSYVSLHHHTHTHTQTPFLIPQYNKSPNFLELWKNRHRIYTILAVKKEIKIFKVTRKHHTLHSMQVRVILFLVDVEAVRMITA